ncbi:MAG: hypothetical protein ACOCWK_08895 [Tangfeifania sp.]
MVEFIILSIYLIVIGYNEQMTERKPDLGKPGIYLLELETPTPEKNC